MNPTIKRISFELSNRCNYAVLHKKCPLHFQKETIILSSHIVNDVLDSFPKDWGGTVAFHTYNEPLMDPRLFTFIEKARSIGGIFIFTNGYYLDQQMAEELVSAGVTHITVSAYSDSEYERLVDLDLPIKYEIRRTRLDDRLDIYDGEAWQLPFEPCAAPLREIMIGCTGEVYLCCFDWKKSKVFGNLYKESFTDVISKPEMTDLYNELMQGHRTLEICKRCGLKR